MESVSKLSNDDSVDRIDGRDLFISIKSFEEVVGCYVGHPNKSDVTGAPPATCDVPSPLEGSVGTRLDRCDALCTDVTKMQICRFPARRK